MNTSRSRSRDDGGTGSVLVLVWLMVLTMVAVAGIGIATLFVAHRRAQSAADLAALAGAQAAQLGRPSCAAAVEIARRNRAAVRSCRQIGEVVEVRTEVLVAAPPLGPWRALAQARAGPVSADGGR